MLHVTILSEGAYPISKGGVSEWLDTIIRNMHDVEFNIFCITPQKYFIKYDLLRMMKKFFHRKKNWYNHPHHHDPL